MGQQEGATRNGISDEPMLLVLVTGVRVLTSPFRRDHLFLDACMYGIRLKCFAALFLVFMYVVHPPQMFRRNFFYYYWCAQVYWSDNEDLCLLACQDNYYVLRYHASTVEARLFFFVFF